jgi:DNA-binding Lrp family transcriptional regulator
LFDDCFDDKSEILDMISFKFATLGGIMMKTLIIDKVNANILKALLKDARTSFTEMAKKNGITAAAVRSRYENLKNAGVITGAIMQINPQFIGFNCYGFLGIKAHPERVKEVQDYLSKQPCILATWNKIQESNIGNYFAAPNLEHFTEISDRLKSYPHIKSVQPLIYVGLPANEYPENLVIKLDTEIGHKQNFGEKEAEIRSKKSFMQTPELEQMNKIDREIARMLSQDARVPFSTVAKKVKISTSQVIKKYRSLKENRLFLKSSITVDPKKLGYQANAMIYIKTALGTKVVDIHKRILGIPNVIMLGKVVGECDLLAIVPVASFEELFELDRQFRKVGGIEKVQVNTNPPFPNWPFNFFAPLL